VASLGLVSHGAVTDGVTIFFPLKSDDLLLIIVTTPLAFQVIVSPVFFVNSAAENFKLSLECHPLDGVTSPHLSPHPPLRPPPSTSPLP